MKLEWALATLVAGGTAGSAGLPAKPPTSPAVAVNYNRGIGWSGSVAIEIQHAGDSTILTTFNDDGRSEIGLWRAVVPPAKFDQLLELLHHSGYTQIPTSTTVPPGTKLVSIGERMPGQDLPILHSFVSLPEPLVPTVTFLEGLQSEIRAHPLRVLRGQAAWKNSTVARGESAILEVTLANVGTSPLHIANPLAEASGWSGLRLVWKQGAAGGEQQEDLTASDLRLEAGASRVALLPLAPGQSIRFKVSKKIALPQGRHASRLEYHSVRDPIGDAQFIGGVVCIDLGEITVTSGPWWKVW
jgi:hypothetical protein